MSIFNLIKSNQNRVNRVSFGKLSLAAVPVFLCLFLSVSCSNEAPKLWMPERSKPAKDQGGVTDAGRIVADKPEVDILFVIDDSGSMGGHQGRLANNIGLFVNQFFNGSILDYHIGVTTSSTSIQHDGGINWPYPWGDGKLMGSPTFVDRNTPNGLTVLKEKMVVGTKGAGYERFFSPVKMALTEPNLSGFNKGFYRPDAHLALVFITDAEEQSTELPLKKFEEFLLNLKSGNQDKILSYAVIIPTALGQSPPGCIRDPYTMPHILEKFIADMKGQSFGLCDADFGQKLAKMGANLADRVGKYIFLGRKPIEHTIVVRYGTQIIPQDSQVGWMYDPSRVALLFGEKVQWSTQPRGTQVEVDFKPANVLPEDQ